MGNRIIKNGLLIRYDPTAANIFTVERNTTDLHADQYMPSSDAENLVVTALNSIYNANSHGKNLFNSMISGEESSALFAIGINGSGSGTTSGKFDFDAGKFLPNIVARDIHGMYLSVSDIPAADQYGRDSGFINTIPDRALYLGSDGAFHSFSAERVIAHELSHNVLQTRDFFSSSLSGVITHQNSNTKYFTDYSNTDSATDYANTVMITLGEKKEIIIFSPDYSPHISGFCQT